MNRLTSTGVMNTPRMVEADAAHGRRDVAEYAIDVKAMAICAVAGMHRKSTPV